MRQFDAITKVLAKSLNVSVDDFSAGFKPAVEFDFVDVVNFWESNLDDQRQWSLEKYLRWRYSFSEESCAVNSNNKLWIMKIDGRIRGMLGAQSMPLTLGDRELDAIHTMDLLVDKSISGGGLGAWMAFALNRHHEVMVLIGSNKNSFSMVQRIFHSMPNRQKWKIALDLEFLIERLVRNRRLARMLAFFANPIAIFIRNIRLNKYIRPELTLTNLTLFPESVSRISLSHKDQFLYRHRDSAFLNWKFVENPNINYQLMGIFYRETLVGYTVLHLSGSLINKNNKDVTIDDFFWLDDATSEKGCSPEAVLAMVTKDLQAQGFGLVEVSIYGERCRLAMENLGFIQREGNLLFSLSCNDSEVATRLYEPDDWFLTDADAHGVAC